jgi:hypothetical protein
MYYLLLFYLGFYPPFRKGKDIFSIDIKWSMFLKNDSKKIFTNFHKVYGNLCLLNNIKSTHFKKESEFGIHALGFITQQANSFNNRRFGNQNFSIALVMVTEKLWPPLPQQPNPFSVLMHPKGSLMKMKIFLCSS